jgi:hypothetical protein
MGREAALLTSWTAAHPSGGGNALAKSPHCNVFSLKGYPGHASFIRNCAHNPPCARLYNCNELPILLTIICTIASPSPAPLSWPWL